MMDINEIDFPKIILIFDKILERGLCRGSGLSPNGQMCIEQAVSLALDLPFLDEPSCVTEQIKDFQIELNDSDWSSESARAKGLRDLGIAQIGSKDVVDGREFQKLLMERLIYRNLIPELIREFAENKQDWLDAANRVETADLQLMAFALNDAFDVVCFHLNKHMIESVCYANDNLLELVIEKADLAHQENTEIDPDKYLLLGAKIALDVLKELKSPGCNWI